MASIAEHIEQCLGWTMEEVQSAEAFLAQRRALIQSRQSTTLEVRIREGDHDQWFLVGKQRLNQEC